MGTIWTILLAVGLPSALVTAVVGLFFRRVEKKIDHRQQEQAGQEEARKEFELFQVKMLTAVIKLCEANAIALQNGKCNGETHAALDYLKKIKHEQRDFLIKEGVDHLF